MVEERIDLHNTFDYSNFIENFKRVCNVHNSNCVDYRDRVERLALGKKTTLGFLIDIPYPYDNVYRITDSKGTRTQALNGLPITNDMIHSLQDMRGFDFIIMCMYCIERPTDIKRIACYYFSVQAIEETMKQQRIKPVKSFEFIKMPNVTFLDKYEIDEEQITVPYEISFDNRVSK